MFITNNMWSYLMVYLHFHIVCDAIIGVFRWVMEQNRLCVPLDYLCRQVIRWLCGNKRAEVSLYGVHIVLRGLRVGYLGSECRHECELHACLGLPPVEACRDEIDWGLLLPRVVAVADVPIRATLAVVPVGCACVFCLQGLFGGVHLQRGGGLGGVGEDE